MDTSPTALVVDDEPHIRGFLEENLRNDDFIVHTASSVAQARSKLHAFSPDIVLLDVMLPDSTGFELCREIREHDGLNSRFSPDIPIIMLTARGDDIDRVRGFQRGADDYVLKPFFYPELLARIQALLRRSGSTKTTTLLQVAGVNIDMERRKVVVNGSDIQLSSKEFLLLSTLAREPDRVFSKKELLRTVWGYQVVGTTRTLDSHASRLRRKLRPVAAGREYVANVWGVGYRFVNTATAPA